MTPEILIEANNLKFDIKNAETTLNDIRTSLRELELEKGFLMPDKLEISLNRNKCLLDVKRLIEFLKSELEIEENKVIKMQSKFDKL